MSCENKRSIEFSRKFELVQRIEFVFAFNAFDSHRLTWYNTLAWSLIPNPDMSLVNSVCATLEWFVWPNLIGARAPKKHSVVEK